MWVPVAVWQPCELLYTCYLLTRAFDRNRVVNSSRARYWSRSVCLLVCVFECQRVSDEVLGLCRNLRLLRRAGARRPRVLCRRWSDSRTLRIRNLCTSHHTPTQSFARLTFRMHRRENVFLRYFYFRHVFTFLTFFNFPNVFCFFEKRWQSLERQAD